MKINSPFRLIRISLLRPWAVAATWWCLGLTAHQAFATSYYVNDNSTNNDRYCTAVGLDSNDGTTSNTPVASLSTILQRHTLSATNTVYIDAGTYNLMSNVVIEAEHKGSPDAPIRIIGAPNHTLLKRSMEGTDRCCLEIHADHIRVEGLTCMAADTGISIDASQARHVQLVGNTCSSNTVLGIEVKPYDNTYSGSDDEYQILQNVVVNNGAGLFLQGSANVSNSLAVFIIENNTLCNGGDGVRILNANRLGKRTNFLKNNIIETASAQAACMVALPGSLHYSDFNNLRARPDGCVVRWENQARSYATLADWQQQNVASGKDKHSLSLNCQFVNAAAGNFRPTQNSPCVDAGVNSFWMFDTADADGNPRISANTCDIGAYELHVKASVQLFLQGPYLSGMNQMRTALAEAGALPHTSPYADDPRIAATLPSGVTDWVLVQFRQFTNGPALHSRSAFLRSDGWIVDDAGKTNLDVNLPPTNTYYVVVKHRNHLAAMSSEAVLFTNQSLNYDFTRNPSAYFGGPSGCVTVGTNWALRAGDADGDGTVLTVDQTLWTSQINVSGYRRADLNLDGTVTIGDRNFILENPNVISPVPHPETMLQPALRITPSYKTVAKNESFVLSGLPSTFATASTTGSGSPSNTRIITLSGSSATENLNWGFVTNGSGAFVASSDLSNTTLYTAGNTADRTDVLEAWNTNDALGRAYLNIISTQAVAMAGQSIIIAGRSSPSDTLWPTTDYLADNAYTTLRYRGFSKENIRYLSPDPLQDVDGNGSLDDIDGASTLANAAGLFTNSVAGTDRLFVYLVDHGGSVSGNGYFRLSGTDTITATQLDSWLDTLQNTHTNTHVTVLLDFCYAGSFLQALTYSGPATRIVIAACGTNQPSYFVAGGLVSFSGAFFSGVMLGYNVEDCFNMAQSAMSTYQAALLDDDQDGFYTAADGPRANITYIGPTSVASGNAPQIGEVCGNQVLTDETSAMLWIGSVSSLHPVTQAWCLIVPPGHNPDPDVPVTDLPQLNLSYNEDDGRYTVTYAGFTNAGTYNVTFYVQDEEGNVSTPRSSYIAQIGYDDRVILVAAGDTNSVSWSAINYLSQLAYATFRLRLFTPDHIRYLSSDTFQDLDNDGTNDVAGAATLASLHASLTAWATNNPTDRLTLYVIGEGVQNTLRLNGSESLTTNVLAAWVHDFQTANPVPVNIVLDFSGAGAFLPALADPQLAADSPEATRIAIASARAGREALFSNGGTVSFSQYLLSGVISGKTFGDAYTAARRAIRRVSGSACQRAQIDDNLNGIANEKDMDGLLADETYLGSAFVTGADEPVIGAVIPPTVQPVGMPITLWASEVAGMYPISNVWCVVTPPGFSGTNYLLTLDLAWNGPSNRYEVSYADFVLPGTYALTFYAQDSVGAISDPAQSEIILSDGSTPVPSDIILSDGYEPDDSPAQASLYDGMHQLHSFHTASDEDWVRFFLVTNFTYDIETYYTSENLDTVLTLYRERPDGLLEPLDTIDEEGRDQGEYSGLDFPASGWYWAQITPCSGSTNSIGYYTFRVDIPMAELNSLIVLGIDDVYAGALPSNATVTVSGQGAKFFSGSTSVVFTGLTNGTYLVNVPTPTNFFPREDPAIPNQVPSLTNLYYANPRTVAVSGGWRMAGFELLSSVSVTSGIVRDAWTHAFLENAQITFTAASGSLTGTVVEGSVILTSYHTDWRSAVDGRLPPAMMLGACNWNLAVSLAGYQTYVRNSAISNVPAGARLDLGTTYLVPTDTNTNHVADAWESFYFPGGMNPTQDSDSDELDNRSEYLCGTDPTASNSVLRFLAATNDAGVFSLTWSAAGGRSYQILSVTSLLDSASTDTNGPWEAAYNQAALQWADTNAPLHKARFYRVRLNEP